MIVISLFFIGALTGQSVAPHGPQSSILLLDGRTIEGVIKSGTMPGKLSLESDGKTIAFESGEVDRIDVRFETIQTEGGPWQIRLLNGTRLIGPIIAGGAEEITLRHSMLGDVHIPLDQIRRIRRTDTGFDPDASDEKPSGDKDEDTLRLVNGDALRGSVEQITAGIALVMIGEQERKVQIETVREIVLTNPASDQMQGVRMRLANGCVVVAAKVRWEDRKVKVSWFKSELEVPAAQVIWMEPVGGRRVWLSDLPMHTSVDIPYFDKAWPMRIDMNAVGGPLAVGGRRFQHGLGLHSAGRWAWQLSGEYERFRGLVGIDDAGGALSDADFSISLDGRHLMEWKGMKHGAAAKKIDLDVSGGRELVIEVGFGRNGPVQDRMDLVDAALIKSK
jgi:hypothetical protein